jgi:glycosyl hydrolase family 123
MRRFSARLTSAVCLLLASSFISSARAQSSGKAWENVIIDNKTGFWRVFYYWKTPKLLTKSGAFKPMPVMYDKRRYKSRDARPAWPVQETKTPPKNWYKVEFDHDAWPRQSGNYGPAAGTGWNIQIVQAPTELAMICLRGKFEVFKPEAMKDLQITLEYHGGAIVYINGKEIKRVNLPFGKLKPGTLAEKYPMGAYIKPDFETCESVRLRQTRVLIKPNMVKKGINIVAIALYRAPVHEVLDQVPVKYHVKYAIWSHAWVQRAMLHSGWGLTPKTAVSSIDEPVERKKPPGKDILNNRFGYWRTFARWKTAEMISERGKRVSLKHPPGRGEKYGTGKPFPVFSTPGPPTEWIDPDFDDTEWARARGYFGPGWGGSSMWSAQNPGALSVMCARGKFEVKDPKTCKGLQLGVDYVGGLVVYVNGKELARQHLPKGEISYDTLATPYKKPAYFKPVGALLHPQYDPKVYKDHIKVYRHRRLEAVIPEKMLRKGVNVIALETHRAPINEIILTGRYQKLNSGRIPGPWPHCLLMGINLQTTKDETPDDSVVVNLSRPEGVQVWNSRSVQRIEPWDYGNPCEKLHAIRIVGCRGGSFGGHVAFGATDPIEEMKATVSDLKCSGGVIQKSKVEVHYEIAEGASYAWGNSRRFETLWPTPPAKLTLDRKYLGGVQPVWIKVRVPRDAAPGDYTGTLTFNYKIGFRDINLRDAKPISVPIKLKVHPYTLPRPQDYTTFMDLIQSPESVAMRFGVPMWSKEHFRYMKKSFDLLTEIGNKTVYLRLINKTHFGNSESIVRWVRVKGKPGSGITADSHRPDYAVMDKYLDLVFATQGKPTVCILYMWDNYVASARRRSDAKEGALLSELDPKTGKLTEIRAPKYGTPEGRAFWGKFLKDIRARLAKRGLKDEVMIGIISDWNGPSLKLAKFFSEIAPGLLWVEHCHPQIRTFARTAKVGYSTTVWNARGPHDPRYDNRRYGKRVYGWRKKWLACQFHRDLRRPSHNLFVYRSAPEWNVCGHQRGLGRFGGDFWNVLKDKLVVDTRHSAGKTIIHRYPHHSSWWQLVVRTSFLGCGPDGAVPSIHFEVMREGVQNCEARITIEQALLDEKLRAKLGAGLAKRARRVVDDRTWMLAGHSRVAPWYFDTGFTERQNILYATAGEVQAALAAK